MTCNNSRGPTISRQKYDRNSKYKPSLGFNAVKTPPEDRIAEGPGDSKLLELSSLEASLKGYVNSEIKRDSPMGKN